MCWLIYGALQGDVEAEALNAVNSRHDCRIAQGTRHAMKMAILDESMDYRVNDGWCDCNSAIGMHDPNAEEVLDMAALIGEACALDGARTLSFCKTWRTDRCKREQSLKRSEVDLRQLLADLQPKTLYTLSCKE